MPLYIYKKNNNFFLKNTGSSTILIESDITDHPVDTDVYVLNGNGSEASVIFFINLSETSTVIGYKWQVSTDNGLTYSDISNSNSSSLTIKNITINNNNYLYRAIAYLTDYTIISLPALLGVEYLPGPDNPTGISIISQPTSTFSDQNGTASFTVTATSDSPLIYQWEISNNLGFSYVDIPTAIHNTLSPTLYLSDISREDHKKMFRVRVTSQNNPSNYVYSNAVYLFTTLETEISSQPQPAIATNGNATFEVQINVLNDAFSNVSYQWQVSKDIGITYADINGATNDILNLTNLQINDHGNLYRVIISGSCCGADASVIVSESAMLFMIPSYIIFSVQPESISTSNREATFSAEVRNFCTNNCGPIIFQWAYVTGSDENPSYEAIDGANSSSFTVDVIKNHKKKFALIATQPNTNSMVISNTVELTNLNSKPTDIFLSNTFILENNDIGDIIGSFSTESLDDNIFSYSLVGDLNDNSSFIINGNVLLANEMYSFNTKRSYTIQVRSTDEQGLFYDKTFTISVRKVPSLSLANSVSELYDTVNTSTSIRLCDFNISNPVGDGFLSESQLNILGPDPITLSGPDAQFFIVEGLKLKLKPNIVLNYSTKSSYSVFITLLDMFSSSIDTETYSLSILQEPQGPIDIILSNSSILEANSIGDQIGVLSAIDSNDNDPFVFSLVSGSGSSDNAAFSINGNTLRSTIVFNWNTKNTYSIRIRALNTNTNLYIDKVFSITITKQPPPPPPPTPDTDPGDDIIGGDPHYIFRTLAVTNPAINYSHTIDDNIGGDPIIGAYLKIYNEEWKAVVTNTPTIVSLLQNVDFYYRDDSNASWTAINRQTFNQNGFFIFRRIEPYFCQFGWSNLKHIVRHSNCRVGGAFYWMKKAIQLADSRVNINVGILPESLRALGVDGISLSLARFGLHRNDFLATHGDNNLLKISEQFNIFSEVPKH